MLYFSHHFLCSCSVATFQTYLWNCSSFYVWQRRTSIKDIAEKEKYVYSIITFDWVFCVRQTFVSSSISSNFNKLSVRMPQACVWRVWNRMHRPQNRCDRTFNAFSQRRHYGDAASSTNNKLLGNQLNVCVVWEVDATDVRCEWLRPTEHTLHIIQRIVHQLPPYLDKARVYEEHKYEVPHYGACIRWHTVSLCSCFRFITRGFISFFVRIVTASTSHPYAADKS